MATKNTDLLKAVECLADFQGKGLTKRIRQLENDLHGLARDSASAFCSKHKFDEISSAAYAVKEVAGQINVIIHTAGIIRSLPFILERDETVISLSLGAGNSGKAFDLETDFQIAEFKFTDWRGADSRRQNSLFEAFFRLAESDTPKRKCLYVIDDKYPQKFFAGSRAICNVLSRKQHEDMRKKHADKFLTVRQYFLFRKDDVSVVALKPLWTV